MGDGSCTGSSQMAVLIQTVRRDSSEALSLHAAVLHTAVLHTAVLHAVVFGKLYMHTHTHTHNTYILPLCLAAPFPGFLVTLLPTLPNFSTTRPLGESPESTRHS